MKQSRTATPEEALKARTEADELLRAIMPLNLIAAADAIRQHPPSAEAVAILAFHAHEAFYRARQRHSAKGPRKSLSQRIRDEGIKNYAEAVAKAPWLFEHYKDDDAEDIKRKITQAISKAHKRKPE